MDDLSALGSGFVIVAIELSNTAKSAPFDDALYKCVFQQGVTGHLAEFKDGSSYTGTIVNKTGIAGQARWIPAEETEQALQFNPTTLIIAIALMSINQKLDQIKATQEEILKFLYEDKELVLKGAVNMLPDTLEQYRYNSSQELWKSGKLTSVINIKGKAESNIIFFRKQIANVFANVKRIHAYQDADKLKSKLDHNLKYYQLSC